MTMDGASDIKNPQLYIHWLILCLHVARTFSIMHFVTSAEFEPHSTSLKEGANHAHIAFSLSPK
jgi:hypothetical protein